MPIVKSSEETGLRESAPAPTDGLPGRRERQGTNTGHESRGVFLSPRVVDREAFNDFSLTLRALIERAAAEAAGLREASAQALAAQQMVRDLAGKHTAKFDSAAKAAAGLDDRLTRLERMLAEAQQAAGALAKARSESERVIGERAEQAAHGLENAARELECRLTQAGERALASLGERLAAAEARAKEAEDRAETATRRFEAFCSSVDAKLGEARQTISGYEARAVQSIEDAGAGARRAFDGVCESMSRHAEDLRLSIAAGAEVQRERIEQASDRAARRADEAESRVAGLASRCEANLEERRQVFADMLFRAEEAAGEVEALIGLGTALPDESDLEGCASAAGLALPGSLADLILKSRLQRAAAETTLNLLDEAGARAEQTRATLSGAIREGAETIDTLAARVATLTAELAAGVAAAERAAASVRASREDAEAVVREPMLAVENKTAELRAHTASLDTHVRRAKDVADQAVARTSSLVAGLSSLLEQLKPWRGVILESEAASAGDVPPALRRVIDQVRAEIAGDLATIATGLQQIASRAPTTHVRTLGAPARES